MIIESPFTLEVCYADISVGRVKLVSLKLRVTALATISSSLVMMFYALKEILR